MTAKELATKLLEHPDFEINIFEIKFHDFHQEFSGGPLICNSWKNIEIVDIGNSDKVIILGGEIE